MDNSQQFLDEHPDLREHMRASRTFESLKARDALSVDDEALFIVAGDTLGGEEQLFLDALVRGANESSADQLARTLFNELTPQLQQTVKSELMK